jgi:hypothetical protein
MAHLKNCTISSAYRVIENGKSDGSQASDVLVGIQDRGLGLLAGLDPTKTLSCVSFGLLP